MSVRKLNKKGKKKLSRCKQDKKVKRFVNKVIKTSNFTKEEKECLRQTAPLLRDIL